MSLFSYMLSQVAGAESEAFHFSSALLIRGAGWAGGALVLGVCASLVVRSLSFKAGLIGGLISGVLAGGGFLMATSKFGEVPGHLAATCLFMLCMALMTARARTRALIMDDENLVDFGDGDALGARMRSAEAKSGVKSAPIPPPMPDLDLDDLEPETINEPAPAMKSSAPAPTPVEATDDEAEDLADTGDLADEQEPDPPAPKGTKMSRPGAPDAAPPAPAPSKVATKARPKPKPKSKSKAKAMPPKAKAMPPKANAMPPKAKPKGSGKPSWME